MLEDELGGRLEDHFESFEETALASASLASVYKATTRDGQVVAVKVQHPGLVARVEADLWTVDVLTRLFGWYDPDMHFGWMVPDFRGSIEMELDFAQEARNATRVAAMFANQRDVAVPAVRNDLTTKRVLTMEFVTGVKVRRNATHAHTHTTTTTRDSSHAHSPLLPPPLQVSDREQLQSMGYRSTDIANKVSQVFGDMIHYHGFVHCDPHPGNLLIRPTPAGAGVPASAVGKPQLVRAVTCPSQAA